MIDLTRRLLAIGMLVLAVIGLMPLIPLVFGYASAIVKQDVNGTYYPETVTAVTASPEPLVFCQLAPSVGTSLNLRKNRTYTNQYWFQCTNHWGSAVTVSLSIVDNGLGGLSMQSTTATGTIPAGTSRCIKSTLTTPNANTDAGNVRYRATVTAADLSGTIEFAAPYAVSGADSTQCTVNRAP